MESPHSNQNRTFQYTWWTLHRESSSKAGLTQSVFFLYLSIRFFYCLLNVIVDLDIVYGRFERSGLWSVGGDYSYLWYVIMALLEQSLACSFNYEPNVYYTCLYELLRYDRMIRFSKGKRRPQIKPQRSAWKASYCEIILIYFLNTLDECLYFFVIRIVFPRWSLKRWFWIGLILTSLFGFHILLYIYFF